MVLEWPLPVDYSAAAFVPTRATALAVKALEGLAPSGMAHQGRTLVLTGPPASGKTHLLRIWQQTMAENPLALAVDDVGQLDMAAQQALFHSYNRLREQGGALLVTSTQPLPQLALLADLASRLAAAPQVALDAPDDADIRQLLLKWAADRQMHLTPPVVDYLLARVERSLPHLGALVAALDNLSREEKRAITVPLARRVIEVAI